MTDATPAPATPPSSFFEDLIDFWTAPSKVFVRRDGAGYFGMMMLVTVLLAALMFANRGTMQAITEGEMRRGMERAAAQGGGPQVSAEQMAQVRKYAEIGQLVGIFVVMPVVILCVGLGAWLAARALGAAELGYGSATQVVAWSYLPKVLEGVLMSIQGLLLDTNAITGRFQLSLGVGRFLDPDMSPGVLGLLGRIDAFTIWVSVLIGIGVCAVGKLPRAKVLPAAGMVWAFGAIPALWTLVSEALKG